ncbi:MAG: hypothetical protein ACTHQQ_02520 [Solirubrobacteraceae bacterium]
MREIAPGLFHWTAFHRGIRSEVSSYFISESGVVIDPLLPSDGFDGGTDPLEWLSQQGPPKAILLTNRHHYRHSGRLVEAFDVTVRASEPGMHQFSAEQRVQPFHYGDRLPGGVIAHEIDAICPDETALEIPSVRAVALADGLVRFSALDGPLGFVPDWLMGDDPEAVKEGLHDSYSRLLTLDFDHLLLAHGLPAVGDGKEQLRSFLES